MQTEFEFISRLKENYSLNRVGDDCAVLPSSADHDLVVTADMLVENVDFRLSWTTPQLLGHKALAVSLSDVAAMGASPVWAMVSIAVPDDLWGSGFVERFYKGWHALAAKYAVELVGGDISRAPGSLVIDSIVGGQVSKGRAIVRSGARPGDSIYVTGSLGGAAGGLTLLESGDNPPEGASELVKRQLEPRPQLTIANLLQDNGLITSMIDISDGLSSDLAHICEASGVGANIDSDRIPIDADLCTFFGIENSLQMALNGGEDFELLFTSGEKNISLPENDRMTRIGEITANVGIIELITDGNASILEPKGYRHF